MKESYEFDRLAFLFYDWFVNVAVSHLFWVLR